MYFDRYRGMRCIEYVSSMSFVNTRSEDQSSDQHSPRCCLITRQQILCVEVDGLCTLVVRLCIMAMIGGVACALAES